MDLPSLAIKRPIFITCLFLLSMILGYLSVKKMPVDMFPDVTFPIVTVTTVYRGASPKDIETLITKPLEDEISSVAGIKNLTSVNREGVSLIVAEFYLENDIKDAEQQVRNRVSTVRYKLPADIDEPVILRVDPASEAMMQVSVSGNLSEAELYDLADQVIKPQLQQVSQVGLVEIVGGRKREIRVALDLDKLKVHKIPVSLVTQKLALSGKDVPIGKVDEKNLEKSFRLLGEFPTIQDIKNTVITFAGNERPVTVGDVAAIHDTLADETSRAFLSGKRCLLLNVFKQSKSNTVAVANAVAAKIDDIAKVQESLGKGVAIKTVFNMADYIKDNIDDVKDSIILGVILTVVVVFFFLGNFRSTIITGLALPNSLLGAFFLMSWAGFSFNVLSLLGLSLAVGLLIDDAIVVRENIFRHMELGLSPREAALKGTREVTLAVVATSATILAVFGAVGFMTGMIGQFFKQFGFSVCFAMIISLADSLAMAPMLSAFFGGGHLHEKGPPPWYLRYPLWPFYRILDAFGVMQRGFDFFYVRSLKKVLSRPLLSLTISFLIFLACVSTAVMIPKTFMPEQDFGEFMVKLEAAPGTNLGSMYAASVALDESLRKHPEVSFTLLTLGSETGGPNQGYVYVKLVPRKLRDMNTTGFKDLIRPELRGFSEVAPKITNVDIISGGMRPFNLDLLGEDLDVLEQYANKVYARLEKLQATRSGGGLKKDEPLLMDPEISHKPGKPEVHVSVNKDSLGLYGLTTDMVGFEVRTLVEGNVPAVFREEGREYDIRVRLQEDQRNLKTSFDKVFVPNVNYTMVPLNQVAQITETTSPVTINRENRGRYIRIAGDSAAMGELSAEVEKLLSENGELPLPKGVTYQFTGQAKDFQDLVSSIVLALVLGIIFIFFVLASLYESFITPFTILLVLPLAAAGAFLGLLFTGKALDLFSMIGCILLTGLATKNSILLVDYANQARQQGLSRAEAMIKAGATRLRPILMTSFSLIAGMIPVAIGLNEAARQRTSMGVTVIGGLVSSTLLTLVVIPAAYMYIDRFNDWVKGLFKAHD